MQKKKIKYEQVNIKISEQKNPSHFKKKTMRLMMEFRTVPARRAQWDVPQLWLSCNEGAPAGLNPKPWPLLPREGTKGPW